MTEKLKSAKKKAIGTKEIAIIVVVAATITVLGAFGIISAFAVPGVSAFYIAVGFYTVFCIWFGGWGCVGAAIGTFIAAIIGGTPLPVAIVALVLGGILEKVIPAWTVRGLKMDPRLKTGRDWLIYLFVGILIPIVWAGCVLMATLAVFKVIPWNVAFTVGITSFIVGDIIVCLVISTPLLKGLSGFVMKSQFYMKGWWK